MLRLSAHLAFDDYIKLTQRFHFLVALGLPGSGTEAFAEYIQFQCNCSMFWRRNACQHSLLCGTYLKKSSGGFIPKPVVISRKLPSRIGVEKVGREKAKEYCRMAQPKCAPSLRTGGSSRGSVPTSLTTTQIANTTCPFSGVPPMNGRRPAVIRSNRNKSPMR